VLEYAAYAFLGLVLIGGLLYVTMSRDAEEPPKTQRGQSPSNSPPHENSPQQTPTQERPRPGKCSLNKCCSSKQKRTGLVVELGAVHERKAGNAQGRGVG
jgi:hypothetical protein